MSSLCVAGIDPGITGAIAFHLPSERRVAVFDMPIADGEIDAPLLARLVRAWAPTIGIIERVHAMPGQGVVSMFNFGRSVGYVRGVFGALGIELRQVTPQTWKAAFGLIGREKDASRTTAITLFPQLHTPLHLKKHHGRADALLIAQWGVDQINLEEFIEKGGHK